MPRKPSDRDKLCEDASQTAYRTLQEATGERPKSLPSGERPEGQKNPRAVKRGRKGGDIGGDSRATALSPERRKEIARKAAQAHWEERS